MKSSQHTIAESSTSQSSRASSVLMGRQDYVSAMLRLTGMELYKIRRRLMSKVLSFISILATVSLFGLIALATFLMAKNGTPAEAIQRFSEALRLPESLSLVVQLLLTLGQILIIILVSTIVGGEHTDKTVRLMLTRGPTRTQFLLSKIGAAIVCIVLGIAGIALLGILTGSIFSFTTGIAPTFDFFSISWLGHAVLYLLITMFGLFTYAMMALFLSTLGRATAAGMVGVLTWSFLIEPVISVIALFGKTISGPLGSFFQSLPDYLIGSNISALLSNQDPYIFSTPPGSPIPPQSSNIHGLLVLCVYSVVFIGVALWVNMRRDVLI
jgi:ABC-type transport system involved in multi-copper enzyme maturation permease subunit